jgi:hypothetical protein
MRQSKPKSSQSLQIDEQIARELIVLLEATFSGVNRSAAAVSDGLAT